MLISELEKALKELREQHGDIPIELSDRDQEILGLFVRKGYPGLEPENIAIILSKDCFCK